MGGRGAIAANKAGLVSLPSGGNAGGKGQHLQGCSCRGSSISHRAERPLAMHHWCGGQLE